MPRRSDSPCSCWGPASASGKATFGAVPASLDALTRAQTGGGPFLASIPAPPAGWSPYQYARQGTDRFTVSSSGGGVSVSAPE